MKVVMFCAIVILLFELNFYCFDKARYKNLLCFRCYMILGVDANEKDIKMDVKYKFANFGQFCRY